MKNRFIVLFFSVFVVWSSMGQIKMDTLYYDKDWKGVADPAFASYFRIIPQTTDSIRYKNFRDYYITGELQTEGGYVTIDKEDDSNSVFDGEYIMYYKSGQIKQKGTMVRGVQEGEYVKYRDDGLISLHAHLKNNRLHGLVTRFLTNGDECLQVEYDDGEPLNEFGVISNKDGFSSKVRLSDLQPIYESPLLTEKSLEYKDGKPWQYYDKNSVVIAVTKDVVRDYGKYFQLQLIIVNNSMFPIELDPDSMTAMAIEITGCPNILKVYSVNEYMRRVKRRQSWAAALYGMTEGFAAGSAGYSTSTTNTSYSGFSSTYGTTYSGYSTSTTTTYNAAAAYQARVVANERISAYTNELNNERQIKNEGYLKRTTIYPGESVLGYINIEYKKKIASMMVDVTIHNAIYSFFWEE